MKKYGALYNIPLFRGVCETELEQMLSCLDGKYRRYQKQALLLAEGEAVSRFGIVLEGSLQVASEDIFGNRNIVEQLDPGELYGAAFACAEVLLSPVSIIAVKDSLVLDLDIEKVLTLCPDSCPFHRQLIQNMVHILAKKNVALSEKIRHTSKRTTREKLLSYLSAESKKAGKRRFRIPFDRQEMADYLCVERSAMSAELGKLRREGVIDFRKNEFLIKTAEKKQD